MQKMRALGTLPDPYGQLQIFADLSQHTLSRHRQLNNITKTLHNNQIQYQWIAPAKISITYNGSKHTVSSVKNGMSLLQEWGIIPDTSDTTPMDQSTIRNLQAHPLPQRAKKPAK